MTNEPTQACGQESPDEVKTNNYTIICLLRSKLWRCLRS